MYVEFDKQRVVIGLRPFSFDSPAIQGRDVTGYKSHYGYVFEENFPDVIHRMGKLDVLHYHIAVQSFSLPDATATVFLVHGYYDHAGLLKHVIQYWLERKVNIVAFDLPGHGLSSGDPVSIPSFEHYQEIFKAVLKLAKDCVHPWYVLGQSTGSGIVADYLLSGGFTQETCPFKKIILMAPLVRPVRWPTVNLLYYTLGFFKPYVQRTFARNSSDKAFLKFLCEGDPLQSHFLSSQWVGALLSWVPKILKAKPVDLAPLILQGDQDTTVDFRYNLKILKQKFKQAKIVIISGARHHLPNESAHFRDELWQAMDNYFHSLPNNC